MAKKVSSNITQEVTTEGKWSSIRCRPATIKRLEDFKIHPKESLESVIKKALSTHAKVQEIKKKKRSQN